MRRSDRGQCLRVARVVEQHAATTIDLDVDEARQQGGATQIHTCVRLSNTRIVGRHDRLDLHARQQDNQPILQAVVGEHACIAQRLNRGSIHVQTVSVTLFKCGGKSGLWPRCNASALMAR